MPDSIRVSPLASLDLAGSWTALPDPGGRGEREAWFAGPLGAAGDVVELRLPGSAQAQGLGSAPDVDTVWVGGGRSSGFYESERYAPYREKDDFKIPFWLQPDLVYVGSIWYQREVEIEDELVGSELELLLERVHWESTLWVDGQRIGSDRSLTTPHRFRVAALTPGRHRITLRIDNSMIVDVGPNAHSVSDHTQGGWNGIIGELSLSAVSSARLIDVQVHPDPAARAIRVRGTVEVDGLDGAVGLLTLRARPAADTVQPTPAELVVPFDVPARSFTRGRETSGDHFDIVYPLGDDARLWHEFDPSVYELTVAYDATAADRRLLATRVTTFGLREVEAAGTRIRVNGREIFLRGTLECCVFPDTGHPPRRTRRVGPASSRPASRTDSTMCASIRGARRRPRSVRPTRPGSTCRWRGRSGPTRAPPSARAATSTSSSTRRPAV